MEITHNKPPGLAFPSPAFSYLSPFAPLRAILFVQTLSWARVFLSFNEAKEPRACRRPVPRSAFTQRRHKEEAATRLRDAVLWYNNKPATLLTPTQSLSCFCQQSVGERDSAEYLQTYRLYANTTLSVFTHIACWSSCMHKVAVQTAIKLTSASVCLVCSSWLIIQEGERRGVIVQRQFVQSARF